jgi:hypothetical protein
MMARAHHLFSVVPAKAGTHTPQHPIRLILRSGPKDRVSKDGAAPCASLMVRDDARSLSSGRASRGPVGASPHHETDRGSLR